MELFLIASIAGRWVAIETKQVESVVDLSEIVAVPGAIPAIRGLAALRSRVVTVIDTGTALGIDPTPGDAARAVITWIEGHHYAVLVEALEDVREFTRLPLSRGMMLDHGWSMVGTGLIERDGEPLLIVDLAALIPTFAIAA